MADARYYELLELVTRAGWEAIANGVSEKDLMSYGRYQEALRRLQAHTEVCDCVTLDFEWAFPELKTIKTTIVPLSETIYSGK